MSNTPARTAETKVTEYRSTGRETTRYETDFRFAKREYGGWTIHLTDPSAIRTFDRGDFLDPDTSTGSIGWVTKNHDGGGWDLWHAVAGEIKAQQYGRGWSTREEAAGELIRDLLQRHLISPASTDEFRYLGRDFIDHNELVLTASRTVEKFQYEIDYERITGRTF